MLGKLWSIYIVPIFEIIGNISYLCKYILGFKVLLLLVLYRISFNFRGMVTLVSVFALQ